MSASQNRWLYVGLGLLGAIAVSVGIFAWAAQRPAPATGPSPLDAAQVSIRNGALVLENRGQDDWTVIAFTLTASTNGTGPRYRASVARLNAGQQIAVPLREFVTEDGVRFDVFGLRPGAVEVSLHALGKGDASRVFAVQ